MGPSTAYDIVVNVFDTTHEVGPGAPDWPFASSGWAFGMPPAINPEQWPLDPDTGYPLMHGFTLQLPEEYRCHGPKIVGVSFFGSPPDHEEGTLNPRVAAALAADAPPTEPDLLPFYEAAQRRHPRVHVMTDTLEAPYAVILLTAEELAGPRTTPPPLVDSPALAEVPAPRWLTEGSAAVYDHPRVSPARPPGSSGRETSWRASSATPTRSPWCPGARTRTPASRRPTCSASGSPTRATSRTGWTTRTRAVTTGSTSSRGPVTTAPATSVAPADRCSTSRTA